MRGGRELIHLLDSIALVSIDPDRAAMQQASEDELLLRGMAHRTADEIAAVVAGVSLASSTGGTTVDVRRIERVVARLRGFGDLNRLLARPLAGRVDLATELSGLCLAVGQAGVERGGGRFDIDVATSWVSGRTARRLLVVAAGLVAEAVEEAMNCRLGRVRVALSGTGDYVSLVVEDDALGPRLLPQRSEVLRSLSTELLGRGSGTLTMVTGRMGTRVTVAMPSGLEEDDVYF